MSQMTRKQKRTLRRALTTAGEVALRYTMEASVGMKAFDGPPLGPKDLKDLLLRNFRIRLPVSEAAALIAHFVKVSYSHRTPRFVRSDVEKRARSPLCRKNKTIFFASDCQNQYTVHITGHQARNSLYCVRGDPLRVAGMERSGAVALRSVPARSGTGYLSLKLKKKTACSAFAFINEKKLVSLRVTGKAPV